MFKLMVGLGLGLLSPFLHSANQITYYPRTISHPLAVSVFLDTKESKRFLNVLGNEFLFVTMEVNQNGKIFYSLLGAENKDSTPEKLARDNKTIFFISDNLSGKPKISFTCAANQKLENPSCRFLFWSFDEEEGGPEWIRGQFFINDDKDSKTTHLVSLVKDYGDAKSLFQRLKVQVVQAEDKTKNPPTPYEYKHFGTQEGVLNLFCGRSLLEDRATDVYVCAFEVDISKGKIKRAVPQEGKDALIVPTQAYENQKQLLEAIQIAKDQLVETYKTAIANQTAQYNAIRKQMIQQREQVVEDAVNAYRSRIPWARSQAVYRAHADKISVLRAIGADNLMLIYEGMTGRKHPANYPVPPQINISIQRAKAAGAK